ncbi:hypothetical protein J6590_034229 [Homalodisca vitripennis]|nr:hypothetical protein J6590_034229 [Homalodisca vitripennis]
MKGLEKSRKRRGDPQRTAPSENIGPPCQQHRRTENIDHVSHSTSRPENIILGPKFLRKTLERLNVSIILHSHVLSVYYRGEKHRPSSVAGGVTTSVNDSLLSCFCINSRPM